MIDTSAIKNIPSDGYPQKPIEWLEFESEFENTQLVVIIIKSCHYHNFIHFFCSFWCYIVRIKFFGYETKKFLPKLKKFYEYLQLTYESVG